MTLFSGIACFSPSVPIDLQKSWLSHGGTISTTSKAPQRVRYFFCAGKNDPWLPVLLQRSIAVFHASWISRTVAEQFPLPIGKYVLDERYQSLTPDAAEDGPPPYSCFSSRSRSHSLDTNSGSNSDESTSISTISLKRSLETEGESICDDERPHKRTRFAVQGYETDSEAEVTIELGCAPPYSPPCRRPAARRVSGAALTRPENPPYLDLTTIRSSKSKANGASFARMGTTIEGFRELKAVEASPLVVWGDLMKNAPDEPCPTIAIDAVLRATGAISVSRAARFNPGSLHFDKQFSCMFLDQQSPGYKI